MSSPRVFHLCQDRNGLHETYQELQNDSLLYVLCDAISLTKSEHAYRIARDFERILKKYLTIHLSHFNEKILEKAIQNAQKHFFDSYSEDRKTLKVSALILIEKTQKSKDLKNKEFYLVCIGDLQVFRINPNPSLIYQDPEVLSLPPDLSIKKRFNALTNAIGMPHLKTKISCFQAKEPESLVVMSYGTYNLSSVDKWLQLAADFEHKKTTLTKLISNSKDKEHLKHFLYFSQGDPKTTEDEFKISNLKKSYPKIPYFNLRKSYHFLNWAFKISLVLILGLCILEITHHYPSLVHLNHSSADLRKNPIRDPDMQLNLRSLKKPIRFPLIKERAFMVDLKEKYERQNFIIEKLNERLLDQDKALRDLQIKSYSFSLPPTDPFAENSFKI